MEQDRHLQLENSNGVGVEKTWPLNSPLVKKVDVVRRGKGRRAKGFTIMRDKSW